MDAVPVQQPFKAEIQQLLHILIHSLYTDRDIFLRELVSNASDALNRAQFEQLTNPDMRDASAELAIRIIADPEAGTLTIRDSGIGMNADEMAENLGVIAHSGARGFIEAIRARQAEGAPVADVIGQFGVGFYSAFMAADRVRVLSRSYRPEDGAFVWEASGGESYTLEPAEKAERGTDVILYLKDDAKEYLQDWKLREVIRKHSNYVTFPIRVGEAEDAANKQTAIWRQDPKTVTDEQYNEFYQMSTFDFTEPVHRIHLRADVPLQFYALLYIPASGEQNPMMRREPGLKVYARKVLIEEANTDLLPEYLPFVQGVVDSEDLPLSVSRESVQSTRVMATLKQTLTKKVLSELAKLAKSDPDKYRTFYKEYGRYLKQGIPLSPQDREAIEPLLRFTSTRSENAEAWVSLAEYVERMAANQEEIYYVIASDYGGAARSPHLDAFRKRGIEVLYMTDPVDPYLLMSFDSYKDQKLRSADEAGIDLSGIGEASAEDENAAPSVEEDALDTLIGRVRTVLGDRVSDVRIGESLVNSPARLVSESKDPSRNLFRIQRLLDREYELPVKMLEINPRHPLLHNLAARLQHDGDAALIDAVIAQLFETALLQDGIHPDPASMADRLILLMQAATK